MVALSLTPFGYGRRAMDAAARWCRDRGMTALGLNVFGDNAPARALYDALGYRVVREVLAAPVADAQGWVTGRYSK